MNIYFDASFISFYLSFVGILGMLGFKALEIRSGRKSWISRLADKTDHIVHDYRDNIKRYISYINRRSALVFVQWIAYHILTWARNAYIWAYKKAHAHAPSKKVIDMVRGKGEVNRNGGSSFYLKSISGDIVEEEVKR
ncbi:MAG: hypothetical protein Q7S72_00835 [Candidatus Taylorbacteria bacterium]|nr:hypothetical protein [Candidatus Taylorbacteria bacterium]